MIPFNMMYNMSVLRHWFSNELGGGGGEGGGDLNHLPLLFCKSVYKNLLPSFKSLYTLTNNNDNNSNC